MQTIPYPVYYVLVVNDGEILAGHYWYEYEGPLSRLMVSACANDAARIKISTAKNFFMLLSLGLPVRLCKHSARTPKNRAMVL